MNELWVAFIIACNLGICAGEKTYSKEHFGLSETLCLHHAKNWAILMKLNHNKEYGYGCDKNTYEPQRVK